MDGKLQTRPKKSFFKIMLFTLLTNIEDIWESQNGALQRIEILPKTQKLIGYPYIFRETIYPVPETYFPAMDQVAMYMLQLNR